MLMVCEVVAVLGGVLLSVTVNVTVYWHGNTAQANWCVTVMGVNVVWIGDPSPKFQSNCTRTLPGSGGGVEHNGLKKVSAFA